MGFVVCIGASGGIALKGLSKKGGKAHSGYDNHEKHNDMFVGTTRSG